MNLIEELLSVGGVLIGSRALSVSTKDSDYDIAICYDDLPDEFKSILESDKRDVFNIKCYFNYLPPLGNAWVIPKCLVSLENEDSEDSEHSTVDILVFTDKSVVEQMKDIIEDLKKLPKSYLQEKQLRVSLFERGLHLHNWTDNVTWK